MFFYAVPSEFPKQETEVSKRGNYEETVID